VNAFTAGDVRKGRAAHPGYAGAAMTIKALTLDAYGTLLQDEDLTLIPRRIVADHRLTVSVDEVLRIWIDLYHVATQRSPFRTLRAIQAEILSEVLRQLGVTAGATPYVEQFFEITTRVTLYPETLRILRALTAVPTAIVSNADVEHTAAWRFDWPVKHVIISETVRAYKPHPGMFEAALEQLNLPPHEVLHVGDSQVDDLRGAKDAGLRVAWLNRRGRARLPGIPTPDFEIGDLTDLPRLVSSEAAPAISS
jgi:2-haloalkanoic acid dehalogenase type II